MALSFRRLRFAYPNAARLITPAGEARTDDRAESGVVEELRAERQRANARELPPRDSEVERRDREPRCSPAQRAADAEPGEHERPAEREREMHRDGGGDEPEGGVVGEPQATEGEEP